MVLKKLLLFCSFVVLSSVGFSQIIINTNINNNIIHLSWEYESEELDHFRIFSNGVFREETVENEFYDTLYFVYHNVYRIEAMGSTDNSILLDSATIDLVTPILLTYPFYMDFEGSSAMMASMSLEGQSLFDRYNSICYSGETCVGFHGGELYDSAILFTPPFSVTDYKGNSDVHVSFYYYTPENNGVYDVLSFGCDDYGYNGGCSEILEPVNEWTFYTYTFYQDSQISYFFKAISGGGNGVYIDNIRFETSSNGLYDESVSNLFKCYPNPVKEILTIDFYDIPVQQYLLSIVGTDGRVISQTKVNKQTESKIEVDVYSLSSGMYFVNLQGEKQAWKSYFIKQ